MVMGFLSKLVTAITLKKVLIWTIAGILLVVGYTAYEHRSDLFDATVIGRNAPTPGNPVGTVFSVGEPTKKKIAEYVKADKDIVAFTVLAVDIRLNLRNQVYFYADPTIVNPPTLQPLAAIQRLPLFTKNEENNRQMIKLINGEFTCSPYSQTLLAGLAPAVNQDIVTVCRASLPPYYGHFSGYVSIMLTNDPDVEQQLRLKQYVESLATEIYFRDVIPTTRRVKI